MQNAVAGALASAAASGPVAAAPSKMIGIQVGAVSFVDEGVTKVLDIFQEAARVNTLFVATFTYGRGIAGRQVPGQPLPDHGKQEYDTATFKGGSYTRLHPHYYRDTVIKEFRAPDFGDYDVLEAVVPEAKKRGMKTICWFEDVWSGSVPNIAQAQEKRFDGSNATTGLFQQSQLSELAAGNGRGLHPRSVERDQNAVMAGHRHRYPHRAEPKQVHSRRDTRCRCRCVARRGGRSVALTQVFGDEAGQFAGSGSGHPGGRPRLSFRGTMDHTRRSFLEFGLAAALPGIAGAQAKATGKRPWYLRTYRWGQINITERDPEQ
jgi:hypothetical protein